MNRKKILTLILALTMLFALAACSDDDSSDGEDSESDSPATDSTSSDGYTTLTLANRTDPGNYSPYGSGGERVVYENMLYERLASYTYEGEIELVLLTDYERVEDGVYHLYLYDYIHDTEGNPFTASDVIFSFEKADASGSYADILAPIASLEAIDDYTVELTMENERAGSLDAIMCSINMVTEAAWIDSGDDMVKNAVGTSPYAMVDFVEDNYVTYQKTNNYWQTDESLVATRSMANVDEVTWVIIYDTSASAIAVETGEIDHSHTTSSENYGLYMDEDGNAYDGYQAKISNSNMMYGMTFNASENSVCADVNMRMAICYAIDTEAIATNVFKGYGRAVGNYVHPAYADYVPEMEDLDNYFRYDVDKAKEHLELAGYDGETVKILVAPTGSTPAVATLIQAYLDAVGINCELMEYESATYYSYLYEETGEVWDFVVNAVQGASGVEYLWSILYANDNSLYDFGSLQHIFDDELQTLYEEMIGVNTNSTETVMNFLDYLNEQCYQYGILCFDKYSFAGSKVTDLQLNGLGHIIPGACTVLPD